MPAPTVFTRASRRRQRWRRLNALLSGGVGVVAVGLAMSLGVTAPSTSPVQPVAGATSTPAGADAVDPADAGTDAITAPLDPVAGDRGGGGGGRDGGAHTARSDRRHR